MKETVQLRSINDTLHNAGSYVYLNFYLLTDTTLTTDVRREIFIVENLHAKVFLGMDIATPEG